MAADSRCGAGWSGVRAPRTVLPSTATATRSPPVLASPVPVAVQVATAASKAAVSRRVAILRIVASLGAATSPVSGSGSAPNASSSPGGAAAAHWAAPVQDSKPEQANETTSTPRTNPSGCRRPPPGRGSGTVFSTCSRFPADSVDTTRGRAAMGEDGDTGAAPTDDDWLDTVIIGGPHPPTRTHQNAEVLRHSDHSSHISTKR